MNSEYSEKSSSSGKFWIFREFRIFRKSWPEIVRIFRIFIILRILYINRIFWQRTQLSVKIFTDSIVGIFRIFSILKKLLFLLFLNCQNILKNLLINFAFFVSANYENFLIIAGPAPPTFNCADLWHNCRICLLKLHYEYDNKKAKTLQVSYLIILSFWVEFSLYTWYTVSRLRAKL